jgi:Cys-tRNA(Pro)/Cys-tRNA(Cys) deacylase
MPAAGEKTNALRHLDANKVAYTVFNHDPALSSAVDVARSLGLPADQVYKTLVALADDGQPLLVMMPGNSTLDVRRLAQSIGVKSVRMAPQREAERLTGLQVGGIGALALAGKPFAVYLERAALAHEQILVNGGRRGLNIQVRVDDLRALTGARLVDAVADP